MIEFLSVIAFIVVVAVFCFEPVRYIISEVTKRIMMRKYKP